MNLSFVGRAPSSKHCSRPGSGVLRRERCELITVLGNAGVGKSRLTAELVSSVNATTVRGRCLSYGEGITYFPVVEVLKQLDAVPSDATAAAALRSLLGETDAHTSADEIAWAFRKLLEEQAPIVCVFDDIQWGEETFLDLIEHVALLSSAPILLLCLARPDFVERRPDWRVSLRLEPLPDADAEALIPASLPAELRSRIAHAAGGNPLFLTEMAAMAADTGADVLVPPNLQALLAARLDQLEAAGARGARARRRRGRVFHRGAVQTLSEDGTVVPRLAALVRKELIRPTARSCRATTPSASGTSSSATPPTTASPRPSAQSSTSASPTGWTSAARISSRWTRSSASTSSRQLATKPSSGRPTGSWRSARANDWPPRAGGSRHVETSVAEPRYSSALSSLRGRGLSTCTSRSTLRCAGVAWRRRSGCRGRRRASAELGDRPGEALAGVVAAEARLNSARRRWTS